MFNRKKYIANFYNLASSRLLQHFLFWLLSFRVLLEIFATSSEFGEIDYIYTAVFIFTLALPVYVNLYLLIPHLFSKRKYFRFSAGLILLLIFATLFNHLTFSFLIDYIFPEYYFISYYNYTDIIKFMVVFIALTSLLKFSRAWFILNEANQRLKELEKQKVISELKSLRSQLNPHFLFNSLNNIYSLVMNDSDKAPDAIIKLGDILRYVIYRSQCEWISLKEEADLISDYIDLQKLRTGQKSSIEFNSEGTFDEVNVPPLLFLPIIENGFKHGLKAGGNDAFLYIYLFCKENVIQFVMHNSKGITDNIEPDEWKGLGMENVIRRLDLIYAENYKLDITEDEKQYRLNLQIHTKT